MTLVHLNFNLNGLMRNFAIFGFALILSACAAVDKPNYFLNDATLRNFQSGDSLTYTILNEKLLRSTTTFSAREEFTPNNSTIDLHLEERVVSDGLMLSLLPQYTQQNADGDLLLRAISNGGELLWLVDEDEELVEEVLFPSDISTLSGTKSFSRKLLSCDEFKVCIKSGSYSRSITLENSETIETTYATFEAYRLKLTSDIQILKEGEAGSNKTYTLSATIWVYPLLGMVKYIDSRNVIGNLSQTNISIDDAYKQNQATP